MSVCGGGAGGGAARGDTRKTDTSKRKDVKKDGGTQGKRGERLVRNSKYVYSNDICCAQTLVFLHPMRAYGLLPLRLIAAQAERERLLRVMEMGMGGSGVGIWRVSSDGERNGRG